ncbi:MAG: carbohydrate ABC transporter permease [Salinirussus sp.]
MGAVRERVTALPRVDSAWLFLLAALVPLGLFFALLWFGPMLYTILVSFFADPLGKPQFVGLGNYLSVMTSETFPFYLWNSVLFAVSTTVLSLVVGLGFALVVDEQMTGRQGLRTLMIFPYLLPTVVVVFLWTLLLDQNLGLVNRVLLDLGLVSSPIAFFANADIAMPSVVTASVWKWGSFAFFILLANLQAIPDAYYERAQVQGASPWQQFRDITLPHLRNAILLVLLVRGIWMFNKFDIIWLTTRGGPVDLTTTLPIEIYDLAIRASSFGAATALAGIMFAILAVAGVAYFVLLEPEAAVTD